MSASSKQPCSNLCARLFELDHAQGLRRDVEIGGEFLFRNAVHQGRVLALELYTAARRADLFRQAFGRELKLRVVRKEE